MKNIDDIDLKILSILKNDSRTPYTKIAEELKISEAAVRKRIEKLKNEGIIKKFTIEVDLGEKVQVLILISVLPSYPNPTIAQAIRKINGIEQVYEVAGEVDIIAIASGRNIHEINRYIDDIRKIEGIAKTSSMIVLRSWI